MRIVEIISVLWTLLMGIFVIYSLYTVYRITIVHKAFLRCIEDCERLTETNPLKSLELLHYLDEQVMSQRYKMIYGFKSIKKFEEEWSQLIRSTQNYISK